MGVDEDCTRAFCFVLFMLLWVKGKKGSTANDESDEGKKKNVETMIKATSKLIMCRLA